MADVRTEREKLVEAITVTSTKVRCESRGEDTCRTDPVTHDRPDWWCPSCLALAAADHLLAEREKNDRA